MGLSFALGLAAAVGPAVFISMIIYNSRSAYVHAADQAGMHFPPPTDLVYALTFGTFVVVIVREWAEPLFAKLAKKVLAAKKLAIQDRVDRFAGCSFKFFAYVALSVYGYECLKEETWFPRALGGTAPNISNTFVGWPLHQGTLKMRYYYGAALSYHGHSIFFLMRQWSQGARRNDFYEMTIHHLVTIALLCSSHMLNWTRIGAIVLFIHDVSDIFTYQIKAVTDMDSVVLTAVGFLACVGGWFYLRLFVLPMVVIRGILVHVPDEVADALGWGVEAFALLLSALVCLHLYWMYMVLGMGKNAIMGKGVHNQDHYQLSMEGKHKAK